MLIILELVDGSLESTQNLYGICKSAGLSKGLNVARIVRGGHKPLEIQSESL